MKEEKIKIKSEMDGLVLDCLLIEPNKDIKGVVQLAHGMNEHKERYIDFMKFLASNGYATFINDHRGHGKSLKSKDDLGYFYDEKADFVVEDLHQLTKYLRKRYKTQKIILMGHSMGSMIVRKYISKYDDIIDGLIVCGSPSKNKAAALGLKIIKIMEKIKGDKHRSKLIKKLMFGGYDKKGELPNNWICTNNEIVKKYNEDELCQYEYTLNGYENIVRLMLDIYNPNIYNKKNPHLPILFIAGADDPVISSEKDWNSAQDFLKGLGYKNIKGILYQNQRHEILNELENKVVYNDILKWLNKIIK